MVGLGQVLVKPLTSWIHQSQIQEVITDSSLSSAPHIQTIGRCFSINPKHLHISPLLNMSKMILGIFVFYSGLFLEVYFFVSRLSSLPPPLTPDTITTYPAAVHPNYSKVLIVSHYLKDHSWCGCSFYPNYFSSPAPSHPVLLFAALQRHPAFSLLSPVASEWSALFYKIFKRWLPYHSRLSPMFNKCFL